VLDPDLEDTLPGFLDTRRAMLDEMPGVLAAGDRATFKRLGHKLAGSFALYGFRWAAAECRAIQLSALSADPAGLSARVAALRGHLDSMELPVKEAAQ
jgi:two-component system response regulator BaeR